MWRSLSLLFSSNIFVVTLPGKDHFNVSYAPTKELYESAIENVKTTIMFKCNRENKWNSTWTDNTFGHPRGPQAPPPMEVTVKDALGIRTVCCGKGNLQIVALAYWHIWRDHLFEGVFIWRGAYMKGCLYEGATYLSTNWFFKLTHNFPNSFVISSKQP